MPYIFPNPGFDGMVRKKIHVRDHIGANALGALANIADN